MKVLFVDIANDGHHVVYLKNLVRSKLYQSIILLPEILTEIDVKQYPAKNDPSENIFFYMKWLHEIKSIAKIEKVDIILFMQMDPLMKYFAFGLSKLKEFKVIIIYHHFWNGFFRSLSYRCIARKVEISIVHTQTILEKFKSYGIKNVIKIEYPAFGDVCKKSQMHIPKRLLFFGATRYDKGLDILLEALKNIKEDYFLFIVGQDTYFDKKFIEKHIEEYKERVYLDLRFVNDQEKEKYFIETDIVILPYRRIFDGASGPLTDGVIKEKIIIGPNHGSIRDVIEKNHIGYTFESESVSSLTQVISKAINTEFIYDKRAIRYKKYLAPIGCLKNMKQCFIL